MAGGRLGHLMRFVRGLAGPPVSTIASDRQLLERFSGRRDEAAFAELVARHGPMIFNVCRRMLDDSHAAEDAFQAVFLVLARKAASLHWHDSIGNWLYETAYRTASRAKADAARRRTREQQVPPVSRSAPMSDADWRELRAVLDEELSRLPAKYRSPVVFCYLEGKSNEEAAHLLGWPIGTVSGRLARARDLLRERLARRGLALSAGALGVLLSQHALEAALPPMLAASAVHVASGSAPVAGSVLALSEGVLQAMFLHKLKLAAALVLLLTASGVGLGLLTLSFLGRPASAVPIGEVQPKEPPSGPEVNGLKLTLRADRTETAMKADGSNAEPIQLRLTVTNVSDKPIKFDAYQIAARHLKATVTAPTPDSVRVQRVLADVIPQPPVAAEFPTIEPRKSWSVAAEWTFPGYLPIQDFGGDGYTVLKPGEFRIKFDYVNGKELNNPLAKGVWTGTLTSNEVVLTVKPAGADQAGKPAYRVLKEQNSAQTKMPTVVVLKDQKAYQTFFEETFARSFEPKPKPAAVDFRNKQVVAICWSEKPTTRYAVSVVALTGDAKELVLTVNTATPKGASGAAITYPAAVVEVPKCEKLKVVITGDRLPAGTGYKDFTGSTTKELEVQVK